MFLYIGIIIPTSSRIVFVSSFTSELSNSNTHQHLLHLIDEVSFIIVISILHRLFEPLHKCLCASLFCSAVFRIYELTCRTISTFRKKLRQFFIRHISDTFGVCHSHIFNPFLFQIFQHRHCDQIVNVWIVSSNIIIFIPFKFSFMIEF